MNFQQVKQANGNNITMFATFNEVGGVSYTRNNKEVSKCQLTDDSGEKHRVRLYGTMPLPSLLNMRQEFSLSSYQGKNTQTGQPYTGYSGFWNDRAQVNQVPANAPPAPYAAPQAPQPAPQQPNVPQVPQVPPGRPQALNMPDTYAYPVTPETARRMARTAFITAILRNNQDPLLSYVTGLVEYSYTGIEPSKAPDPDLSIQNEPVQAQFCDKCRNLKEECTCGPAF